MCDVTFKLIFVLSLNGFSKKKIKMYFVLFILFILMQATFIQLLSEKKYS